MALTRGSAARLGSDSGSTRLLPQNAREGAWMCVNCSSFFRRRVGARAGWRFTSVCTEILGRNSSITRTAQNWILSNFNIWTVAKIVLCFKQNLGSDTNLLC